MVTARRRRRVRPRPVSRIEPLEARAMLTVGGVLDPAFGTGAGYVVDPSLQPAQIESSTVQPDGRVVLATGTTPAAGQSQIVVERIGLDGKPDPTFGTGGQVSTITQSQTLYISGLAIQPDGKILVAATGATSTGSQFSLMRYDADGSIDTTFGTDGRLALPLNTVAPGEFAFESPSRIGGLAVRPAGQIDVLAVEATTQGGSTLHLVVFQFNADGTPDTTFGTNGQASVAFPGAVNPFETTGSVALALGADGKLVVDSPYEPDTSNPSTQRLAVARLDTDGSADTTFGAGGVAVVPAGQVHDVLGLGLQPDGKILLLGDETYPSVGVTRLDADGTVDATFGTTGLATFPSGFVPTSSPTGDANGGILLSGNSTSAPEVVRLTASGQLDPDFGNGEDHGLATYNLGGNPAYAAGLALEPGGTALLLGSATIPRPITPALAQQGSAIVAARILLPATETAPTPVITGSSGPPIAPINPPTGLAGQLDRSYGGGTGYTTSTTKPLDSLSIAGPDGTYYAVAYANGAVTSYRDVAGSTSNFSAGIALANTTTARVESLAFQPDGKLVAAGVELISNLVEAFVVRFNADGTPDGTFGINGVANFAAGSQTSAGFFYPLVGTIDFQPDGGILLAGAAAEASGAADLAITRLTAAGALDKTFNATGTVLIPVPGGLDINATTFGVNSIAGGQILVAGTANQLPASGRIADGGFSSPGYADVVLARVNAQGQVDPGFGGGANGGVVVIGATPTDPTAAGSLVFQGIAPEGNGDAVIEATVNGGVGLVRVHADGTIDPGFGTTGTGLATLNPLPDETFVSAGSFAIEGDLKILVGGVATPSGGNADLALARFTAAGLPDPSFGNSQVPGLSVYPIRVYSQPTVSLNFVTGNAALLIGNSTGVNFTPAGGSDYNSESVARVLLTPPPLTPAVLQPPADYDGSGRTNLATYYAAGGEFLYQPTGGGPVVAVPFGVAGAGQTLPAPGDYTGAGQAEIAAYLPDQGVYAIRPAGGGPDVVVPFGIPGTGQSLPAPGDYEGSGRDDIAVYMPSIGAFGLRPSTGGPDQIIPFGIAGTGQSLPAPADYFGTGRDDIAVYLAAIGAFAIRNPAGGPDQIIPFGRAGIGQSIPIPGDYDGSGHVELAVYMPATGTFAYRPYGGGPDVIEPFGAAGDGSIPVPGDYTGAGHAEVAVYDPNYASFAYRPAGGGPDVIQVFGTIGLATTLPAGSPPGAASAQVQAIVNPGSSARASAASVKASAAAAVPGGPMAKASSLAAGRRAGLSGVAQGVTDPSGKIA